MDLNIVVSSAPQELLSRQEVRRRKLRKRSKRVSSINDNVVITEEPQLQPRNDLGEFLQDLKYIGVLFQRDRDVI